MVIENLELKNIGPFNDAYLDFIGDGDIAHPPVTIITGENGTGKTIILDAIRFIFFSNSHGPYGFIERDINRNGYDTNEIKIKIFKSSIPNIYSYGATNRGFNIHDKKHYAVINHIISNPAKAGDDFVINYWTSKLATDTFEIKSLVAPDVTKLYDGALSGTHQNVELTQLITYFDYLKSSESQNEKILGEKIYEILKKIIKLCLLDGELKYVSRATLEPIINLNGQEITLEKLSSGNLYLMQRMVSMLGKMFAVHVLNNKPIEELCKAPGVLLIDEAENHLHPKWQKTFLKSILEIFPNLQIILTTHSPFIVSSYPNARVYVCESKDDHSEVVDRTAEYSNKSIEEILTSDVFNTSIFNNEITSLLEKRKNAIENNNQDEKDAIENKLKELNPNYFSYLDIDSLLKKMTKKS